MRKIITILMALCLILATAVPAYAVTTLKWDFSTVPGLVSDTVEDYYDIPEQETEETAVPEPTEAPAEYAMIFDYNGGYRVEWDGYRVKLVRSATVTGSVIPEATPWHPFRVFRHWESDGVIYHPGDPITQDMTLTAVWEGVE